MQSLQTIAEQCLPDSWENDGSFLSCREATDNFNLEPVYKCQFCETMLKGNLLHKLFLNIYYDSLADEWSLGEHIKNHTGQNKYFCNICNKICNTSNELSEHIIEHTFIDLDDKTIIPQEPIKQDFKSISCNVY